MPDYTLTACVEIIFSICCCNYVKLSDLERSNNKNNLYYYQEI